MNVIKTCNLKNINITFFRMSKKCSPYFMIFPNIEYYHWTHRCFLRFPVIFQLFSYHIFIKEMCSCHVIILGTAYYALGLVAITPFGSESLGTRGWVTIRHCRGQQWPIATDWLQQVDSFNNINIVINYHRHYLLVVS